MKETTMTQTPGARPSGRHPVNVGHLVMGLAFVGLVGVWALIEGDVVDGADIRWLLPVPWVLAGLAGLLATTLSGRDRWAERRTGWVGTEPRPDAAPYAAPYDTYTTSYDAPSGDTTAYDTTAHDTDPTEETR
jgi:hypothetical protein